MAAATETTEQVASHKNEKVGEVISTKMAKTIVVEVTRRVAHPVYKRIVQKRKKFYAHDEKSSANVGDIVRIIECRPLSRLKRWELERDSAPGCPGGGRSSGVVGRCRYAREEDDQEEEEEVVS